MRELIFVIIGLLAGLFFIKRRTSNEKIVSRSVDTAVRRSTAERRKHLKDSI